MPTLTRLPVEQVLPKMTELELIKDGKPVSLNAFKKMADIHRYGRSLRVIYVGTRDNKFGFYPQMGCTQKEALEDAYGYFMDCVSGYMSDWNCGNVCWGNCGIPISYSKMRCLIRE